MSSPQKVPRILIIGAGMSGLLMAIKLQAAGIGDFRICEKAGDLGGTWRENTYPGIGCDVAAHYYTYQGVPNPDWSTRLPQGAEIQAYLQQVTDEQSLRRSISFNKEAVDARHDGREWTVHFRDGESLSADFLIACCGLLHHPRYPDIPGLADFAGPKFHSARWNHGVSLEGKRIGLIGNGSTGAQIISRLSEKNLTLKVFQRTPQWIFPLPDRRYTEFEKRLLRAFPGLAWLLHHSYRIAFENLFAAAVIKPCWQRDLMSWLCRRNLQSVKDPALRARLTPDYEPLCKRLVMSMEFYPAIQRNNVRLITDAIDHITPDGIVTRDGVKHAIDVLALATGFDAHTYFRPLELHNAKGTSLSEVWADGPHALRTVAVPGFPNFFFTLGPQSPIGNFSAISIAETQIDYIMRCVEHWRQGRLRTLSPKAEAADRFSSFVRRAMPDTIWVSGCTSWYVGKNGVPSAWPYSGRRFRQELREPDLDEYDVTA